MAQKALQFIDRANDAIASLQVEETARLVRAMQGGYKAIEADLKKLYPSLLSGDRILLAGAKAKRLEQLKAGLALLDPESLSELESSFTRAYSRSLAIGQSLGSELLGLRKIAFNASDIGIEAAAIAAKDSVRNLARYSEVFRDKAGVILTQGILQGQGVSAVQKALVTQLNTSKTAAGMIAATELLSASNKAAIASYAKAGIEYGQLIATRDDRTCPLCAARNLSVYRLTTLLVPLHPRCRCFVMPYDPKWREAGLIDNDWETDYYQAKRPDKLNQGISPSEKLNGISQAPTAFWRPNNDRR